MVTVVLLTTLLTPLALRGAFQLKCAEDDQDMSNGVSDPLEGRSTIKLLSDNARDQNDLGRPMNYASPNSTSRNIGVT